MPTRGQNPFVLEQPEGAMVTVTLRRVLAVLVAGGDVHIRATPHPSYTIVVKHNPALPRINFSLLLLSFLSFTATEYDWTSESAAIRRRVLV